MASSMFSIGQALDAVPPCCSCVQSRFSTHPPWTRRLRRREDIERELAELSAQVDAAKHRQLMLIHEADVEGCWAHTGARSCVDWLGWRIGMAAGTAREHLRVARALKKLPLIDAEMERGKLSYSKVRALTRVATPENEETLSDMALNSTAAMLERICRGVKLASRDEDGELIATPEPERWVNSRWEGDGMTRVTAVLSADEAELLMETLRSVRETMKSDESEAEPSLADALVHVAEQAAAEKKVQEAQTRTTGGDAQMVVLHLRESMLGDGVVTQLEDGSRVSAETFRRVACDASLLPVLEGELGQVLNVGRKTRSIPSAVRRAVEAKHGRCCSFPGCTSTRFIHFHHVQHWAHGGETSARNLLPLCSFHHRLVHEGGWTVQYDGVGHPEFRQPSSGCEKRTPSSTSTRTRGSATGTATRSTSTPASTPCVPSKTAPSARPSTTPSTASAPSARTRPRPPPRRCRSSSA